MLIRVTQTLVLTCGPIPPSSRISTHTRHKTAIQQLAVAELFNDGAHLR